MQKKSIKPTEKIFGEFAKLHWVWFWSGNWPRLDAITERDPGFEKELKKMAGFYPKITADIFRDGLITAYHCQEEYDRIKAHLFTRYEIDPNFIIHSLSDYEKKTVRDIQAIKKITSQNFSRLSNGDLGKLFIKVRRHWEYNSAVDHWAWYVEKFFTPVLEQSIRKHLSSLGKNDIKYIPEYVNILVTPRKPSEVYRERVAFYQMIKKIKKVYIRKNDLFTQFYSKVRIYYPRIAGLISDHAKRYGWLSVLVNNPPVTEEDVWKEAAEKAKSKISLELEVKRLGDNFDQNIIKKKIKLLDELKSDAAAISLIKTLERTSYIRTQDNAVMSHSAYLTIPLYEEISKRLGISYYGLKELTPWEVLDALNDSINLKNLIKSRRKLSGYVVYDENRYSVDGKDAKVLKKIIDASTSSLSIIMPDVLTGVPASLGIARGIVKILLSSNEAKLFNSGEVLVAPATSADFVPTMRKAKAIITQMGGLTSHAAVVAREFGIPCIVGVNNATSVLRTGDLVEVNANKGTIKIIKTERYSR